MRILIHVIVFLLFYAASSSAWAQGAVDAKNLSTSYNTADQDFVSKFLKPGTYMPVSQIKPGMEGYGLSVFNGTKIERFDVKVIGIMKRVMNGRDAILVRMSGAVLGRNNVVRGMSGSPVYIDDKLVGAVSYGFDFSTEPIAGLTPVVDMLDAMAQPEDAPRTGFNKPGPNNRIALSPSAVSLAAGPDYGRFRKLAVSAANPHMVPLMSPVSLSGFSPRAQGFLRQKFETIGLSVADGTGGGISSNLDPGQVTEANKMKPGSAVGVMLTTGDFESASTGTVTSTFGGKVLAFGHPFVQAGLVDFPMASAYVHEVLPSLSISFKLSSPIAILGKIYSDRPWAIGGQIGKSSNMVPLTIEVEDDERHIKRKFASSVVHHEDLTPELVSACAMSAIDATYQSSAPYVAQVETVVAVDKKEVIHRFDCLSNSSGGVSSARQFFSDPVSSNIYSITSRILGNRYKKAELSSVSLKIHLQTGRSLTRVVRVSTDRAVVHPGESVKLNCLLEPYDGESLTETLEVAIPRDAPDGDLLIGVAGGSQLEDLRRRMNLVDPPVTNLPQIYKRIQDRARGDRLFAVIALPDQSIHIDGEVLESPPGHWNKLFFSNRYTHGPALVNGERRVSKELTSLVDGSHILAVTVKRKEPFLEKAATYFAPTLAGKPSMGTFITSQAQKVIDGSGKSETKKSDEAGNKAQALVLWSPAQDTHLRSVQLWNQSDEADFKGGTRDGVIIDSWGRLGPGFKETGSGSMPGALRAWSSVWNRGCLYVASSNRIYKWTPGSASAQEIAKLDAVAIPAMAVNSKGVVFAALAPSGSIVAIDPVTNPATNSVTTFATLKESIITSLAVGDNDSLYAGVAGTGKIYKFTGSGSVQSALDTGQAHVISLFFDKGSKRLFVGTGEVGNVYSVGADSKLRPEFQTDEHLVTGVCRTKNGDLYVATAGDGHMVRISPAGETFDLATSEAFYTLFYNELNDSVLAGDAEGDVTEIRLEPLTGQTFFVPIKHTEQEAVVSLTSDDAGRIFALTSNLPSIFQFAVKPEEASYTSPVKDATRQAQWSLLRILGSFTELNVGLEKTIAVETRSGETSRPDALWSPWTSAPKLASDEGFQIKSPANRYFQYRIKWLSPNGNEDMKVFPWGRGSVIGRVAVTYLPQNLNPRFVNVSMHAGAYVSGNEELTISGSDPDGDTLALSIDLSSDGGRSWKQLKSQIRSARSSGEEKSEKKTESPSSPDKPAPKIETKEEEKPKDGKASSAGGTIGGDTPTDDGEDGEASEKPHPDESDGAGSEIPSPDEGDKDNNEEPKIEESASDPNPNLNLNLNLNENGESLQQGEKDRNKYSKKVEPAKKPTEKSTEKKPVSAKDAAKVITNAKEPNKKKPAGDGEESNKFTWSLPSKTLKDGHYILKFNLTDAPSNMDGPSEMACYRYFVVDNTNPKIVASKMDVSTDRRLTLSVAAADATSPIANAIFKIDSDAARAFAVTDGLADRREIKLSAQGVPLKKGARKVEIEIVDRAGNKATKTLKLPG